MKRFGDPMEEEPIGGRDGRVSCTKEGCEEHHYARGFCRRHYAANLYAENMKRGQ